MNISSLPFLVRDFLNALLFRMMNSSLTFAFSTVIFLVVTPQLHVDKPRANQRAHYNVWNASKAFEAVAETKEDENEDNREGDDKDEPRLIIEALVIRNFEIGEAFLDFGGFGGLEAIEDLGGVNGGSFSG